MRRDADAAFGSLLRGHRRIRGLTQEELAERSGLSVHAVSMLERGVRRSPRVGTVRLLADALDLDPTERTALMAAATPRDAPAAIERTRAEPPEPHAGIPHDPSPHFVGRVRELIELHSRLKASRRVTIHGLGGVGKTQLAARYVHQRGDLYADGVFWLRGEYESDLLGDLASLAWHLRLPERELPERERQVESVLRWLRSHQRWLLVLDDVSAAVAETVHRSLPGLPGEVLMTSRMPIGADRLHVHPLPIDVATDFLLHRTGQVDADAACAVAEALGRLPLALEQAAAYMEVSGRDLAGYADLLRSRLFELMQEGRPHGYPHTVATTWRLALDRLEEEVRAGTALLRLCAFLAPDDIPVGVLHGAAAALPDELRRAVSDEVELDRSVAALRRYALLDRRGDALAVHRLVQVVVRESADARQRDVWLGAAIRLLCASFPDEAHERPETWGLCGRLLSHVQVVERLAADRPPEPRTLGCLLDRAGVYLDCRAQFSEALPILKHALSLRESALGGEHPATAETLDNLAGLLSHTGDLDAARPLYDRALRIREQVVGPDHPETASSLNNLAVLLHRQGQLTAARALYERALSIDERVLGPLHAHTAKDLNNLARLLRDQHEPAAALPLLHRALAISEHTAGPDHPLTATSLNNLAQALRREHQTDGARELLERSLAIYQRVLGDDHPYTAIALANLSSLLREQGELTTARRLAERAVAIQERVLGGDHPDVAVGLSSLALVLESQGDQRAARPLLRRALALRRRAEGRGPSEPRPDEPSVLGRR